MLLPARCYIQGTFREHSGNIQGPFSEYSVKIQGPFSEYSVKIKEDDRMMVLQMSCATLVRLCTEKQFVHF
jgi:hypothetical protein